MKQIFPAITTKDIQKSIDFYTNILGFEVVKHYPKEAEVPNWVEIKRGNVELMLQQKIEWTRGNAKLDEIYERSNSKGVGIDIVIIVENVDELYEQVKKFNYPIIVDIQSTEIGIKEFVILDVDGYLISFAQNLWSI